jgi:hypothetical protein
MYTWYLLLACLLIQSVEVLSWSIPKRFLGGDGNHWFHSTTSLHTLTYKQEEFRTEAAHLLDCLMSPSQSTHRDFDSDKFETKLTLLQSTTFEDLQNYLRSKGIQYVASSSKEDLLTQFLVYQIDPTIKYSQMCASMSFRCLILIATDSTFPLFL